MPFLMGGANTPPYLCSTSWVAELLAAEKGFQIGEELNDFNIYLDLGGMISVGTPRMCILSSYGNFYFYAHQRSGIERALEQAISAASYDEYVELTSTCFILCLETEHALDCLFQIKDEKYCKAEVKANMACQRAIDALRKEPLLKLSPQHDLNVN